MSPITGSDLPAYLIRFENISRIAGPHAQMGRDGFGYLNSTLNNERMKVVSILTDQIIAVLANDELFRIRGLEKEVIEKREIEMLTNIYRYSKEYSYCHALFFIGSGHRESIIKKIDEFDAMQKTKLSWVIRDIDNYLPLQSVKT